ncbi:MAG: alkaline phosphatase PhoX [Woeseia sp.]
MIDRRRFLLTLVAAAAARPARVRASRAVGFGALQPDPRRILDLPEGFSYSVVSRTGEAMDDGLVVPGLPDGMAAFAGHGGQVVLVRNHEISSSSKAAGPYGTDLERLQQLDPANIYDMGRGVTPAPGGTTTLVWDPQQQRTLRRHMSLIGTEVNCSGGATPWGSWLSCEECFEDPGRTFEGGRLVSREQRHGYVFEVPAAARGAAPPQPLREMGRFEHEAAAVDVDTGIVYMSEDRHRSLLYRYLPQQPGRLSAGGRLQALAIAGQPSFDTRNWGWHRDLEPGDKLPIRWIDVPNADSAENDLRFRGFDSGAARFARGEGLCFADGELVLTCTIGGSERLGQVFAIRPGSSSAHLEQQGELRLVAESTIDSLLRNADNLTQSPWGDIVLCEDTAEHCGLVGLTADGKQYPLADNAYSQAELAGICFSPNGEEMFVNIQQRGLTLAIRGPWPRSSS